MDGTNSQMSGNDAAESWKEVVTQFRSLCFMRRQGNASDSGKILEEKLPRKIAAWSRAAADDTDAKRVQLEQMFRDEQRRVDDVWALHELSSAQWRQDLVPLLTNKISEQVRSAVVEQMGVQAERQNQLGEEIKQALAEQAQLQAARETAHQALLQELQKSLQEVAQRPPPPPPPPPYANAAPPGTPTAQPSTPATERPSRIPFDDIPAIIDQINDEEKRNPSPRRSFSARPIHDHN